MRTMTADFFVLRSPDSPWVEVGPGTVVDAMFRKVC